MPDLTDNLKISRETPESIKARLLADTNAGVDPADPSYADTIPGSFWDDLEGANCLELDRVYDRTNEVVGAAIPASASGAFLDLWAQSLGLTRRDAALAGGQVEFTGPAGTVVPIGTPVSTAQLAGDAEPQSYATITATVIGGGGTVLADIAAVVAGSEGNVPTNTITVLDSVLTDGLGTPVSVTVTNPAATTGGADIETDERLSARVVRKLAGAAGRGNQEDYVEWGLAYPGVGYVTVHPNTPVVGNVLVVINDLNNDPMPPGAVAGLQAQLDPSVTHSQGAGLAPIGATVVVATSTTLPVTVAATLTLEPGYSVVATTATRGVEDDVTASLARYINTLPVGADVIRTKVIAAIVDVVGVADVDTATLSLNGSTTGDVAVGLIEVPSLSTTTLT